VALGMPLNEVIRAATQNPARALRRPDLGTLAVGTPGDATVLELREGRFEHRDVVGEILAAPDHLFNRGMVIGGAWWHDGVDG